MFPQRVTVGIVFQGYFPEDSSMLDGVQEIAPENIKIKRVDAETASHYIGEIRGDVMKTLIDDEDYFFQVDSHTKFAWGWDIGLIAEQKLVNEVTEKGYVQGYPTIFSKWTDPIAQSSLKCVPDFYTFQKQDSTIQGKVVAKDPHNLCTERFFNANCVFAPMEFIHEVPIPKEVSFDWEQPLMALRVWTAGWTGFSPTTSYTSVFGYADYPPEELDEHVRNVRIKDNRQKAGQMLAEATSRQKFIDIIEGRDQNSDYGPLGVRDVVSYLDSIGFDPITFEIKECPEEIWNCVSVNRYKMIEYKCIEVSYLSELYRLDPAEH